MPSHVAKNTFFIFLTYFFVLLSYPLVRSSVGATFYEAYSSADYSFATFIGVILLMGLIFINNKLQPIIGIHNVYLLTGLLSISTMGGAFYFFHNGIKEMAYVLFAMKEAYIVIFVHACLAYSNAYYDLNTFKKLIGPIGASGSVGGILGGQMTKYLAKSPDFGTSGVFYISLFLILFTVIAFYFTTRVTFEKEEKDVTPLKAIDNIKKYVLLIAAIVTLSQFVIFIADLQFNIVFEQTITEKNERTAYLGDFYTYINIISLFLQFVVLPYVLTRASVKSLFLFVPLLYLILVFGGLGFGTGQILVIASVFIIMKGVDYSIFALAKEVMYHPLKNMQKYGAKYITDMFVYRCAKAFIAFIMAQAIVKQFTHNMLTLTILQFLFMAVWIALIFKLFQEQKNLTLARNNEPIT